MNATSLLRRCRAERGRFFYESGHHGDLRMSP